MQGSAKVLSAKDERSTNLFVTVKQVLCFTMRDSLPVSAQFICEVIFFAIGMPYEHNVVQEALPFGNKMLRANEAKGKAWMRLLPDVGWPKKRLLLELDGNSQVGPDTAVMPDSGLRNS